MDGAGRLTGDQRLKGKPGKPGGGRSSDAAAEKCFKSKIISACQAVCWCGNYGDFPLFKRGPAKVISHDFHFIQIHAVPRMPLRIMKGAQPGDINMISDQAGSSRILSTHPSSSFRTNARNCGLLALTVFVLSLIGIYWRPLGELSTVWPANAVVLGLFLRARRLASSGGWLSALAGFVLADVVTGSAWSMAVLLSITNLCSVFIALMLCRRLTVYEEQREISPDALSSLFLAMLAASGGAGVIGGLLLWWHEGASFWNVVASWAVAELLAYIIFLPCVLTAPRWGERKAPERGFLSREILTKRLIPAGSLLLTFLGCVFIGGPGVVAFPVTALLICALTCGMFATSVLTLIFSLWTLLGITFGSIQLDFDIRDLNDSLSLRLGVASVALAPIVVASVMASRERNLLTMRHLAEHDALTGLLNRSAFHQRAAETLQLVERRLDHENPVAILMMDIDRFKLINDTYGHAAGDEVLSRIARILRQSLRSDDLCGRLGGEEFAILLPECLPEELENITGRIHRAVKSERFILGEDPEDYLTVSVSIGATLRRDGNDELTAMLARADQALYAAKQGGRDRTCVA